MLQVTERVWSGAINTKITFEGYEYLVQAKRISYFPLLFPQIVEFFASVSGHNLSSDSVWLEYDDVPLKWNLPVGLLHDLLHLPSCIGDDIRPPWNLQLKMATPQTPYPSNDIIPFSPKTDYLASLNRVFINSLKQSCYVVNGNSKAVMALSEDHTRALWSAISHHDYATYHQIIGKIRLPPRSENHRIPIKLYLAGSSVLIQSPVSASTSNGPTTLRNVISQWMPQVVDSKQTFSAYIQGINVDAILNEPVLDVWENLRHLDNFLYVIMIIDT